MLVNLEFIKEYVFCDYLICLPKCFPSDSDGKYSACNAGDPGSVPGSRRSPGEGNGYHSSILTWTVPQTQEPSGL